MEFIEFMDKLAYALINNKVDEMALRQLATRRGITTPRRPQVNKHKMKLLHDTFVLNHTFFI